MPIICSSHSGANDFVSEGKDGFVFNPYKETELKEKTLYMFAHTDLIPQYSKVSIDVARTCTWDNHHKILCESIEEI